MLENSRALLRARIRRSVRNVRLAAFRQFLDRVFAFYVVQVNLLFLEPLTVTGAVLESIPQAFVLVRQAFA